MFPCSSIADLWFSMKSLQLRYATTVVERQVKNADPAAKEITFTLQLPDSAFISNFSMTLGEEERVARVLPTKQALETYNSARDAGLSTGLASQDSRDSNKFSIATSVEPGQKVLRTLHCT